MMKDTEGPNHYFLMAEIPTSQTCTKHAVFVAQRNQLFCFNNYWTLSNYIEHNYGKNMFSVSIAFKLRIST